jgi:3-oxoacyl-[acyl-carrier protein] reductase
MELVPLQAVMIVENLKDRVVLVTGASRGIGERTAKSLSAEGARLILCARGEAELLEVAHETGAIAVPCDVSKEKEVDRLFDSITREYGKLDVVVNNAGIFRQSSVLSTSGEDFDEVVGVNLRGVFLVSRGAFNLMSEGGGGLIINVCSTAGKQGFEGSAAYCASKFGVVGLSKVLAIEGREFGIRISVLCPGAVDTNIWDGISEEREGFLHPDDVASTILFVAKSGAHTNLGEIEIIPF